MKKLLLSLFCLFSLAFVKAQTIPSYVSTQNLKLWMPFDSSFNDHSGNNNNATNFGTTFTEDRCNSSNQAVYFDGNFRKLVIQNSILPSTPTSYSIAFWIKRNPESGTGKDIINDRANVNYSYKYRLLMGSSTSGAPYNYSHNFLIYNSSNAEVLQADSAATTDWEHVVIVFDEAASKQYIYSNGVQLSSRTMNASVYPVENNPTWIGWINIPPGGDSSVDFPFKGNLDDIGMWSRVLDVKEIIALYEGDCNTTSIKDIFKNNLIKVYPNPAQTEFTIENKTFNGERFSIKLINNLGQEIMQQTFEKSKVTVKLDKAAAPGVYYIYLIDKNNRVQSVNEISLN